MLDRDSSDVLGLYNDPLRRLIEDAAKSIDIALDDPKEGDVEAGIVRILPASANVADAHYNAGFLQRACQNHGMVMTWQGEAAPTDLEAVCGFSFCTVAERDAKAAAAAKAQEKSKIVMPEAKPAAAVEEAKGAAEAPKPVAPAAAPAAPVKQDQHRPYR